MPRRDDVIETEGKVVDCLPGTKFRVKINTGQVILCHISGKIRINNIRILPDDTVVVEIQPYDLTQGRIIYRRR